MLGSELANVLGVEALVSPGPIKTRAPHPGERPPLPASAYCVSHSETLFFTSRARGKLHEAPLSSSEAPIKWSFRGSQCRGAMRLDVLRLAQAEDLFPTRRAERGKNGQGQSCPAGAR